jgi:hypothetical protein
MKISQKVEYRLPSYLPVNTGCIDMVKMLLQAHNIFCSVDCRAVFEILATPH